MDRQATALVLGSMTRDQAATTLRAMVAGWRKLELPAARQAALTLTSHIPDYALGAGFYEALAEQLRVLSLADAIGSRGDVLRARANALLDQIEAAARKRA